MNIGQFSIHDDTDLAMSRFNSIVLLVLYFFYLVFTMSEPAEEKPTENVLSRPPDKRLASLRDVREMLLTGMDLNVDAQLVQRCFIEADADDEAEGLDADEFDLDPEDFMNQLLKRVKSY